MNKYRIKVATIIMSGVKSCRRMVTAVKNAKQTPKIGGGYMVQVGRAVIGGIYAVNNVG